MLLTCPDWANLPLSGRPSIPPTKELSQVHIFLLTLPSVFGLSACSNPNLINDYTPGSISQALGCQMWYGITLARWCKEGPNNWFFKAFGSCHQLQSRFRLVCGVEKERWETLIHLSALLCFSPACLIHAVVFDFGWILGSTLCGLVKHTNWEEKKREEFKLQEPKDTGTKPETICSRTKYFKCVETIWLYCSILLVYMATIAVDASQRLENVEELWWEEVLIKWTWSPGPDGTCGFMRTVCSNSCTVVLYV